MTFEAEKQKHAAATISRHDLGKTGVFTREKENIVYSDTPVCVRHWGIFGISAGWHRPVTSPKQNPLVGRKKIFRGWRMSKNGNTASVFSAASVLNSLAYLWFCSKTVTQCRERRLALVMGFNRKCGVWPVKRGGMEGWRGDGGEDSSTKGAATGRWMQINPFSALTEEPKTPAQQNKYCSPGGRAQRDKSLWNV